MTPGAIRRAMFTCLGLGALDLVALNALVLPALLTPEGKVPSGMLAASLPASVAKAVGPPATDTNDGRTATEARDADASQKGMAHVNDETEVVSAAATGVAVSSTSSTLAALMDTVVNPRPLVVLEFARASARLNGKGRARLAASLRELEKAPKLVLVGHADASGPKTLNEKLSRERAISVARRLSEAGFDAARIEVEWRGSREPSRDGRDRRVEIYLGDRP